MTTSCVKYTQRKDMEISQLVQKGEELKKGLTNRIFSVIITELSEGRQKNKEKNKPRSLNRKNRLKKTQKTFAKPLDKPESL